MKKYIKGFFLSIFCVLLLVGCDSETNMPEMAKVNFPKITSDPTGDQLINMLDPTVFTGKVNVDLYFPGDRPQEATLVIAKNGDYQNTKPLQAITQFPTNVTITGAKIQELFGATALDDVFEIGLDATYNGIVYHAFDTKGAIPYSSDLWNLPGSNPVQEYEATYLLDLNDFIGVFHVEDEAWGEEYEVTVSRSTTSETQLIVEGMLGDDGDIPSIVIDVNMATQIPKLNGQVVLADLVPFGFPFTNMTYDGSGKFNIPSQTITFNIGVSVDQTSLGGPYTLIFTKK